jgi:hypothetical protein
LVFRTFKIDSGFMSKKKKIDSGWSYVEHQVIYIQLILVERIFYQTLQTLQPNFGLPRPPSHRN